MEIWKPLRNFPNYNGSSEGRIMNVRTQRILKTFTDEKGYVLVCLRKNNRRHTVKVSKVIAETFLGEHPGMDVRHKNFDRSKNNVDNLMWCPRRETICSAYERGTKIPSQGTPIRVIETDKKYKTINECAKDIGCDRSEIFRYFAGFRNSVKGYHFERL